MDYKDAYNANSVVSTQSLTWSARVICCLFAYLSRPWKRFVVRSIPLTFLWRIGKNAINLRCDLNWRPNSFNLFVLRVVPKHYKIS